MACNNNSCNPNPCNTNTCNTGCSRGNGGYIIIIVLYILLAIILGSCIF